MKTLLAVLIILFLGSNYLLVDNLDGMGSIVEIDKNEMVFVFICVYGGYVSNGQKKLTTVVHAKKGLSRVSIKFFRSVALKIASRKSPWGHSGIF